MSSPFDVLASSYEQTWSATSEGRGQRNEVWNVIDEVFHPGDRVLDLGCGIGDDAIHLRARGVSVWGIDSSQEMAEISRARGVEAHWRWIEDLSAVSGDLSGVLSNFGALNCVARLETVAEQLGRLVVAGGPIALCVMGKFCWRESAKFLLRGKFSKAARRWRGHAVWRGTTIRYWSSREMRRAFGPHFEFMKRVSVGRGDHQLYVFRRRAS